MDQEGADHFARAIASSDAAPSGITVPSGTSSIAIPHDVVIVPATAA
jgi:hypothetical protein